jgi:flagellar biosynthesis/type III secretory pathway protein FliH
MLESNEIEESLEVESEQLDVDLDPKYAPISWEILGKEPIAPQFSRQTFRVESEPWGDSNIFVQGIYVDPVKGGNKILFNQEAKEIRRKTNEVEVSNVVVHDDPGYQQHSIDELVEKVAHESYEKGLMAGRDEANANFDAILERIENILVDLREQSLQARKILENDMISFCCEVMRHFLRGVVPGNEEVLYRVVLEALAEIDRNAHCEILVNEVDFRMFETTPKFNELLAKFDIQVGIENNVRSGCILETEHETFCFDILAAFDRAERELKGIK